MTDIPEEIKATADACPACRVLVWPLVHWTAYFPMTPTEPTDIIFDGRTFSIHRLDGSWELYWCDPETSHAHKIGWGK